MCVVEGGWGGDGQTALQSTWVIKQSGSSRFVKGSLRSKECNLGRSRGQGKDKMSCVFPISQAYLAPCMHIS